LDIEDGPWGAKLAEITRGEHRPPVIPTQTRVEVVGPIIIETNMNAIVEQVQAIKNGDNNHIKKLMEKNQSQMMLL